MLQATSVFGCDTGSTDSNFEIASCDHQQRLFDKADQLFTDICRLVEPTNIIIFTDGRAETLKVSLLRPNADC